jgi:hypothetical protein
VEIGGWVSKLLDPERGTYTSVMTTPGPVFEEFLAEHTEWNLWMASMSPHVQVTEVTATPGESGYQRITAMIQNQGYLPTNVTQQAIRNETAKTVKVSISLEGAELVFGEETVDIGHLAWMIRATGRAQPTVAVTAISEKGGTDSKTLNR